MCIWFVLREDRPTNPALGTLAHQNYSSHARGLLRLADTRSCLYLRRASKGCHCTDKLAANAANSETGVVRLLGERCASINQAISLATECETFINVLLQSVSILNHLLVLPKLELVRTCAEKSLLRETEKASRTTRTAALALVSVLILGAITYLTLTSKARIA